MKVKNISLGVIVLFGNVLAPQQIGDAPDGHAGVQDLIDLGLLQEVAECETDGSESQSTPNYEKMKVAELKAELEKRGISAPLDAQKSDLIDLLKQFDND